MTGALWSCAGQRRAQATTNTAAASPARTGRHHARTGVDPSPASVGNRGTTPLRDADLRAVLAERTITASRIHRAADVLAPRHEIQVDGRPPSLVGRRIERSLGFLRRTGRDPPEAIRNPVDVGIDTDVLHALGIRGSGPGSPFSAPPPAASTTPPSSWARGR